VYLKKIVAEEDWGYYGTTATVNIKNNNNSSSKSTEDDSK
jgi:hypothetical protein